MFLKTSTKRNNFTHTLRVKCQFKKYSSCVTEHKKLRSNRLIIASISVRGEWISFTVLPGSVVILKHFFKFFLAIVLFRVILNWATCGQLDRRCGREIFLVFMKSWIGNGQKTLSPQWMHYMVRLLTFLHSI